MDVQSIKKKINFKYADETKIIQMFIKQLETNKKYFMCQIVFDWMQKSQWQHF